MLNNNGCIENMHELVFYSLIIYLAIRIVGFGVSIDFYFSTKALKFKTLAIGWILWIFATLFPIFAELTNDINLANQLLVINVLLASLGALFITDGFVRYYLNVPLKFLAISSAYMIITPIIITFTLGPIVAINFSALTLFAIQIAVYVIPAVRIKKLKQSMGKSIRWFYATLLSFFLFLPVSLFISMQGLGYGLYDSNDVVLIFFNYFPPMVTFVLFIILLVHLEYSITSVHKAELKDKYSHDLGNILQVILSASSLTNIDDNLSQDAASKIELVKEKCIVASKLLKEIRKL